MNQPRLAPPKPQARIAQPVPTYYVWAMDGKGNSRPVAGPLASLVNAQWRATSAFKTAYPNHFVYIVGWCGHKCIGHWHNLFGPSANEPCWKAGDIRVQVRSFIKPARRTRTRLRPRGRKFQ